MSGDGETRGWGDAGMGRRGDGEMGSLFFVRRLRRYTLITGGGIGDAENRGN